MKTWHLSQTETDGVDNSLVLQHGLIKVDTDIDALRSRLDGALQVIKGEMSDDSVGVDYFGIIFSNTPIEIKVQELSRVMMTIEGINSVTLQEASMDTANHALSFKFRINSVYGTFEYNKVFENI